MAWRNATKGTAFERVPTILLPIGVTLALVPKEPVVNSLIRMEAASSALRDVNFPGIVSTVRNA